MKKAADACQEEISRKTLNIYQLENEKKFEVPKGKLLFKTISKCIEEIIYCYEDENQLLHHQGKTVKLPRVAKVEKKTEVSTS